MDSMAQKYPDIVSVTTYGTSGEGRPMRALKISAGSSVTDGEPQSKPVVWLDSGIHGKKITQSNIIKFINCHENLAIHISS